VLFFLVVVVVVVVVVLVLVLELALHLLCNSTLHLSHIPSLMVLLKPSFTALL
jgi:hypothetical protein